MPFTFPRRVICPFCFGRFHIGFAPIRDLSNSNTEPDEILREFLELPPGSVRLAPVIHPPSGFLNHLFGEPPRAWWRKWFSIKENWVKRLFKFLLIVFLIPIVALAYGMRWLLRFVYFSSVNKSARYSRKRICPYCHLPLPNVMANKGGQSDIIAITGYRQVGKSNFFAVLVEALKHRYSAETGFAVNFSETFATTTLTQTSSDDLFQNRYGVLFRDENPEPVPGTRSARQNMDIRLPLIYRLAVKHRWWDWIRRPFSSFREVDLVFFDAAGEDMGAESNRALYGRYIRNASGIIALVDPLYSKEVRGLLKENKPSEQQESFDTIGALICNLEDNERRKPLALVLTKLDMLEDLPDFSAGKFKELFKDHKHAGGYNLESGIAASEIVRTFLEKHEFNQLLTSVDTYFPNHSFFAVSALGKSPEDGKLKGAIQPVNIADPLFWILYQNGVLREDKDTFTNFAKKLERFFASLRSRD